METLQTIKNIVEDGNMSRLTRQEFAELSEERKYQQYVNEQYRGDTYARIAIQLHLRKEGSQAHTETLEDLDKNIRVDNGKERIVGNNHPYSIIDEVNDFQGVSPCLK